MKSLDTFDRGLESLAARTGRFVSRHPRKLTAAVTLVLAGFGVTAFQMFFFAGFAFAAALAFGLVARSYRVVDHYRQG